MDNRIEVDINEVVKKQAVINIHIKGMRLFRLRVFVGVCIVRFGVWVAGFGANVVDE